MRQAESTRPFQKSDAGRRYAKRRYRGFFQRVVAWREQRLAARLLARPHADCNGHIVDLPCGYGRFYPLLKQMNFQVSALDQSQAMVDIYRDHTDFGERDHAQQADVLQALPEQAHSARRALCVRLFQHLHDPALRVRALQTLAGDGRQIVLTYYDDACLQYWSKRALMRLKGRTVRVKMIPRAAFEAEVAQAGLRIVERVPLFAGLHAQTWVLLTPASSA
ncbi:methyltransferase domain-containing protein [Salinisphaera sp. S4-8]|uniref:class I SAM-dependent methyltransferase n=1 Tax=Salinisphaera sp. S4-8 TaxID=633357 RepID=UPI003341B2C9